MEENKAAETKVLEAQQTGELNEEELAEASGGYLYENDPQYSVGAVVGFRYDEPGRRRHRTDKGVIQAIVRTRDTSCQYLINGETIGLIVIEESYIDKVY